MFFLRKCSRCGNDTNLGALCQECRNYFNKQYRLRKIKKHKLFLIKKDEEIPLIAGIKALEIQKYKCCKKEAKINFLMKECGSYCPYCGVIYNEIE